MPTIDETSFEAELQASGELFRLMDFLRVEGAEVDSIERTTVRFEQVFMRLVKEGGQLDAARPQSREAAVAN